MRIEKSPPGVSFIIPAHNEQAQLPGTLTAIRKVIQELQLSAEVIVVNDDSQDQTEQVALSFDARVLNVAFRHIAATRNAGAAASQGDFLFFVDADTEVNAEGIHSALREMQKGRTGGGCLVEFVGFVPWWAQLLMPLTIAVCQRMKICGGACLFCTKETFERIKGFNLRYFAAEDLAFVSDVKKVGRFYIPRSLARTSSRKFGQMPLSQIISLFFRLTFVGPEAFRSREGLELWYDKAVRDSQEP